MHIECVYLCVNCSHAIDTHFMRDSQKGQKETDGAMLEHWGMRGEHKR